MKWNNETPALFSWLTLSFFIIVLIGTVFSSGCTSAARDMEPKMYDRILIDFTHERIALHLYSNEIPPGNAQIFQSVASRHGIEPLRLFRYMKENDSAMYRILLGD